MSVRVGDYLQYKIVALYHISVLSPCSRDIPLAKNPSTGMAQQRLFLVLKVGLHAVVVISEVLCLSTKSRCSRCCRAHLYLANNDFGQNNPSLVTDTTTTTVHAAHTHRGVPPTTVGIRTEPHF